MTTTDSTKPKSTPSWSDRLDKFAATLPRAKATTMASDLDSLKTDIEEVLEVLEDLIPNLETWADDDADRDERINARDDADQQINELSSLLRLFARQLVPLQVMS